MEELELFEPVSGLEDLVGILESLFAEQKVWVRLEMQEERGETVHEHLLAQFASTLDMIDAVQSEDDLDVALEFLFREVDAPGDGLEEEPRLVTVPIDPQDVEVDIEETGVTLASGNFRLTVRRFQANGASGAQAR